MSKKERLFRFKQFAVAHSRSAMKVGVDGVLLGAWVRLDGARSALDAGCGCGLVALMLAQRFAEVELEAIDIDAEAVAEAADNFAASPWADRLHARLFDFSELTDCQFDHVVSNPPFFDAGVSSPETSRERARHVGALSPETFLVNGAEMVGNEGRISLISPYSDFESLERAAASAGLCLSRVCYVQGHAAAPVKRVLSEWSKTPIALQEEHLVLESEPGVPTPGYKQLCHDFYLRF